jgi:hypothetical protein
MRYLLDYRNQQLPVTSESFPAGLKLLKIRIERLEAVAAQFASRSRLSQSCCGSMPRNFLPSLQNQRLPLAAKTCGFRI